LRFYFEKQYTTQTQRHRRKTSQENANQKALLSPETEKQKKTQLATSDAFTNKSSLKAGKNKTEPKGLAEKWRNRKSQ